MNNPWCENYPMLNCWALDFISETERNNPVGGRPDNNPLGEGVSYDVLLGWVYAGADRKKMNRKYKNTYPKHRSLRPL